MKRVVRVLASVLALSMVAAVAVVAFRAAHYARAFDSASKGESFAVVVARFGQPRVIESPGKPFLRYATGACKSPCARRLWWEHPVLRGIEAWSVEFDDTNRLVNKAHWVSP
jgi:hypothetical protein